MSTPRTRMAIAAVITLVVAVAVVAVGWFEVQTLVIDDRASEPVPAGVVTTWEGEFESLDHDTTGAASVVDGTTGRFVRFEDFETSNGPDLRVYLVPAGADDITESIDLGALDGNVGDQNYELPDSADVSRFSQVLIWCVRFDSPFGAASLTPV